MWVLLDDNELLLSLLESYFSTMWIVAHLQKCQAIKSPHVNELILIGMEIKKMHRLLFISNLQTDDNVEPPLN